MASARKIEKQNIAFLELYKAVDADVRTRLGSGEGVTEYIHRLEARISGVSAGKGSGKATDSSRQEYKMLKHLRWARNKLAHEVDYSTEILKDGDFEWLEDFQKRLGRSTDALSLLGKGSTGMGKKKKNTLAERLRRFFFG